MLNDEDPEVRHAALFALRYLGPEAAETQQWLIKYLKDPRFTMQGDEILVLSELRQDPERAIPILVKFLDESQNAQDSLIIRVNALKQIDPEAAAKAGVE